MSSPLPVPDDNAKTCNWPHGADPRTQLDGVMDGHAATSMKA
jgi:hypothetical protein